MDKSAVVQGTAATCTSSNGYCAVLPRLHSGKLVQGFVFLHADLGGRPYRDGFRDGLSGAVDLSEISSGKLSLPGERSACHGTPAHRPPSAPANAPPQKWMS